MHDAEHDRLAVLAFYGELEDRELDAYQAARRGCAACADLTASLESAHGLARLSRFTPPKDLAERTLARILDEEAKPSPRVSWRDIFQPAPVWALAGGLAAALVWVGPSIQAPDGGARPLQTALRWDLQDDLASAESDLARLDAELGASDESQDIDGALRDIEDAAAGWDLEWNGRES